MMLNVKTKRRLSRRESQEETRRRLIAAAEKVFIRLGFDDSSVEQITEAAGFSRGAFYSNFSDKDELFLAVLDKRRLEISNALSSILQRVTEPAERRCAVREWFVGQWRQKDWIALRIEFSRRAMRNPEVRKRLADVWRQEVETYAASVAQYFDASGAAPADPPAAVALALLAACQGLGCMALADGGTEADRVYTEAAALIFDRFAAPPDPQPGQSDA